jgi:hypothetical protein
MRNTWGCNSFANQRCEAIFSVCRTYRFWLAREWGAFGTFGVFLCHNPSSADALWLDLTAMRCSNLAVHWGWRGFGIVNLFPFISSSLDEARKNVSTMAADVRALNDYWLLRGQRSCRRIRDSGWSGGRCRCKGYCQTAEARFAIRRHQNKCRRNLLASSVPDIWRCKQLRQAREDTVSVKDSNRRPNQAMQRTADRPYA